MADFFQRMSISGKLLLSSLAFALPLAVLGIFMDLSFTHDIGIAESELLGNAYQRKLFVLLGELPHQRLEQVLGYEDGAETPGPAARIDAALDELLAAPPEALEELSLRPRDLAARGLEHATIPRLDALWQKVREGRAGHGDHEALLRAARDLYAHVGETSMLVLDPALDSSHLAIVTSRDLPLFSRQLVDLLHLLERHRTGVGAADPAMVLPAADYTGIDDYHALFTDTLHDHVLRHATIALREDPNFYGRSPSLQHNLPPELRVFQARAEALLHALESLSAGDGRVGPAFLGVWLNAHRSATALHATASAELDTLLELRIRSYQRWRLLGFSLSALALLAAGLLVARIARGITRPVRAITEYAHRVREGDYAADLDTGFGGEMAHLADDIQAMVRRLKHRLAFSQGILESIVAPFLVTDRELKITFVNMAMLRLMCERLEPEEFLGADVLEFFGNAETMRTLMDQCLVQRLCVENVEVALACRDGGRRVASVTVSPLYDLEDALIGASVFIFDLTPLKEHERAILEKNEEIERLAAFPQENPAPVLAAEADGSVTYRNPATERVLARLGVGLEELLPANHKDVVALCLESDRKVEQGEHAVGGRVYHWNYSALGAQRTVQIHLADVTEQRRLQEQILHDAFHDPLTGLPNRALFLDRLKHTMEHLGKRNQGALAVMFLDMDRFKVVNESLGHAVGDNVLMELSKRLQDALGPGDTLARLGGDEYAILLDSVADTAEALQASARLQEAVARPVNVDGRELRLTASVGLVVDSGAYDRSEEILRDADTAMYRAKSLGKARTELFNAAMHESALKRLELEMDLKRALELGELAVFYQPLVDLADGRVHGVEALARWQHPQRGLVSPGEFIPLAEETGLIVPLGAFVLAQACVRAQAWREAHDHLRGLMLSVNLSVRQFSSETLLRDVDQALERSGFPASQLKLEITESGVMQDAEASMDVLAALQDRGIRLSIDDFGTGYSSLSYLHRFPFDFLKVDKSFVMNVLRDEECEERGIVQTIVSLAHDMNKQVIAEGIETQVQLAMLRRMGAEYGQGFLFSRPLPADQAEELLAARPRW